MKVQITYIPKEKSIEQANHSLKSFLDHGYDAELNLGITPNTLDESEFPFHDIEKGRLQSFKINEPKKYPIKKSCLFNNLRFARRVLESNESMIFAEHDAVCIGAWSDWDFEDFLFLSFDYAFKPPTALNIIIPCRNYKLPTTKGVLDFPSNYPLKYYKDTIYKGSIMTPGTAAYALSPSGARKLLNAAETHGLEQSDMIINTYNMRLQYVHPSPCKYSTINLNTSHGT